MSAFTESTIESAAFAWLESLGWAVKLGPEISPGGERPERESFRDVVLAGRLYRNSMRKHKADIVITGKGK